EARARGYRVRQAELWSGDCSSAARKHASQVARARPGTCFLSGGELYVKVRGKGRGGRNQQFVLEALLALEKLGRDALVFSAGTDGQDARTPAAGAWGNVETLRRARKLGLEPEDFARRNDSYTFFKKAGGLVVTGP